MAANWTGIEVCAVLFFASAIRSSLGFGEALVSVPLLALLMPVEVARRSQRWCSALRSAAN